MVEDGRKKLKYSNGNLMAGRTIHSWGKRMYMTVF